MSASPDVPAQVMNTKPLFKLMVERKASDLFFTCNAPVKIKIEGKIFPVNKQVLSPETVRQAALGLMTAEQIEHFNQELEIDFAISESGLGDSASTCSISAATLRWSCDTSPPKCPNSKIWACRTSSRIW